MVYIEFQQLHKITFSIYFIDCDLEMHYIYEEPFLPDKKTDTVCKQNLMPTGSRPYKHIHPAIISDEFDICEGLTCLWSQFYNGNLGENIFGSIHKQPIQNWPKFNIGWFYLK